MLAFKAGGRRFLFQKESGNQHLPKKPTYQLNREKTHFHFLPAGSRLRESTYISNF
jgi:hypothetical protein